MFGGIFTGIAFTQEHLNLITEIDTKVFRIDAKISRNIVDFNQQCDKLQHKISLLCDYISTLYKNDSNLKKKCDDNDTRIDILFKNEKTLDKRVLHIENYLGRSLKNGEVNRQKIDASVVKINEHANQLDEHEEKINEIIGLLNNHINRDSNDYYIEELQNESNELLHKIENVSDNSIGIVFKQEYLNLIHENYKLITCQNTTISKCRQEINVVRQNIDLMRETIQNLSQSHEERIQNLENENNQLKVLNLNMLRYIEEQILEIKQQINNK